jgi:hypothetical protein
MGIDDAFYDDLIGKIQAKVKKLTDPTPKKKRKNNPEDIFHMAVAKALHRTIAEAGVLSPDGVVWFSTELRNAGKVKVLPDGRRINLEGAARKKKGCIAGVPDVTIIYRGRYHGIELKAGKNGLSDAQKDLHPILNKAGAPTGVVWDVDISKLFELLITWEIPHRKVTF